MQYKTKAYVYCCKQLTYMVQLGATFKVHVYFKKKQVKENVTYTYVCKG